MLEEVRIQNFRCLKDVTIKLSPLTVLVGANASGKSAVIAALDPDHSLANTDHWQHRLDLNPVVQFRGTRSGHPFGWEGKIGTPSRHYTYQWLRLDPKALRQANTVEAARRLVWTGANLPNAFATLTRRQQETLAGELCALVPMFNDVTVQPTRGGAHNLSFQDRWDPSLWYQPHEVSDGTMLIVAYLTVVHAAEPPDVLAIEEPEHALHPYLLGQVVSLFQKLANGEIGPKPTQVILATHSAELLDFVSPEQVRFLSRDPDSGSAQVEAAPTDSIEWARAFREYKGSLGNVWLSGSLGGVPGS
jgi:predicted ATPase